MSKISITIVGDGGWGTTLGLLLYSKGHNITIWSAFPEYAEQVSKNRENPRFLPGIKIPEGINIISSCEEASGSDYYILTIPCQHLRDVLSRFVGIIDKPVIDGAKGIENETLKRPSEIIAEVLPGIPLAVLSGPTIAYEVARGIPTTCAISSKDEQLSKTLQGIFSTDKFRVYTSSDITGVELGGALKNIIAIAAGISDGMGFGVNTKAAILTRGLVEITRLGVAVGAKKETFMGLSGVGDLATTCMSPHSRNRWFGEQIGQGKKDRDILKQTGMVVEGIATTKSAYDLARKYKVEMPITEQIYKVLYENKNPKDAVYELMTRSPKGE